MKNKLITILCLFGLFTVFGCGAQQQSQQQENYSNELGIMTVLNHEYQASGLDIGKPQKDCLYKLEGMQIMQKVNGGYLMRLEPSFSPNYSDSKRRNGEDDIAFLDVKGTENKGFSEGCNLTPYWATYIGTYLYQGKQILAFKLYPNKKGYDEQIHPPDWDVKSNIEEPKNLKESKICVMLFCSELQQKANGLEPKEGYLYNLGGMQVMQKVKGAYLLIPSSYFAGYGDGDIYDPVSLYTEQQFQQDQLLSPEMNLWAYYVADTEYTTITGFNKKIHAFRLSDKKFVNHENKNSSTTLESKESAVGTHVSISREAEIALIAQKFVRQKLNLLDYSQEIIKFKYTLAHKPEEPELIVKFADIDEEQVKYLGDSKWLVSSYVDYYNSRKYYSVNLTATPSEEKLNDITFSNK